MVAGIATFRDLARSSDLFERGKPLICAGILTCNEEFDSKMLCNQIGFLIGGLAKLGVQLKLAINHELNLDVFNRVEPIFRVSVIDSVEDLTDIVIHLAPRSQRRTLWHIVDSEGDFSR